MRNRPTVIYYSPTGHPAPDLLSAWAAQKPIPLVTLHHRGDVETIALRNPPALIVVDADGATGEGVTLCNNLKEDAYTAIVPIAFLAGAHHSEHVREWFGAGADEVLTPIIAPD